MDISTFGAGTATPGMGYLRPLRVRGSRRINQDGALQLYVELVSRVERLRRKPQSQASKPPPGMLNAT